MIDIELRGGLKAKAYSKTIKQDDRIVLSIRPEICVMKKGTKAEENGFTGNIEKVTFEGTFMRYDIKLSNGDKFIINKPSLTDEWLNVGDSITIAYPMEKAHVFPYPASGLSEEIAV